MNNNMDINNMNMNNMNSNNINMNNMNFMNMNNMNMNNMNNLMMNDQNMRNRNVEMIKNLINQNNAMMNQIALNNNMIMELLNNPYFNHNQNDMINIPQEIIPRRDRIIIEDHFPGNTNERYNIGFDLPSGRKVNIATPVDIKVKDLLLTFSKVANINERLLGNDIIFLYNGYKINVKEEKNIKEFGFFNNVNIIVYDKNNVIG